MGGIHVATFQPTKSGKIRAFAGRKPFKRLAKTFPNITLAKQWAARIEAEHYMGIAKGQTPEVMLTVAELVDWFLMTTQTLRTVSMTQRGNLSRIVEGLGHLRVSELTAAEIVAHGQRRRQGKHRDRTGRTLPACGGATLGVELTFLTEVMNLGKALKKISIEGDPVRDARLVLRTYKMIEKPRKRDRRPSAEELAALRDYFTKKDAVTTIPMNTIIDFAIGTARREGEITRLRWADLNEKQRTLLLRDVKHPKRKIGNHKTFPLLGDMFALVQRQPRTSEYIFPYNSDSIGAAFSRACARLQIHDLHFHDLRHEATSRLFEAGYSIDQVAMVTLHDSWEDLKRYAQIRPETLHRD